MNLSSAMMAMAMMPWMTMGAMMLLVMMFGLMMMFWLMMIIFDSTDLATVDVATVLFTFLLWLVVALLLRDIFTLLLWMVMARFPWNFDTFSTGKVFTFLARNIFT